MKHLDAEFNAGPYICEVCGYGHASAAEAEACADQPVEPNPILIGAVVSFPFLARGMEFTIIKQMVASVSHEPVALAQAANGETQGVTAEMFEKYRVR